MRESMTWSGLSSFSRRMAVAIVAATLAGVGCGGDGTTTPNVDGGGGTGGMGVDGTTPNTIAGSGGSGGAGGAVSDASPIGTDTAGPPGDGPAPDVIAPTTDGALAADVALPKDGATLAPDAPPVNLCGNGVKDPGEACDVTAKDDLGRCPDVCPVQACTTRKLINAGTCMAQCVADKAQTACANGDGCCPAGCNSNNDDDCPIRCDNGVQEAGETCDPLTNCPKSCPRERCEIRQLVGGGTCQAECRTIDTVKTCIHNDGCCPIGCTNDVDNDCDASCDNGKIEAGETCDPRASCPNKATCVAKGCQHYELKNPDTCRAACVPSEIFYGCVNGDGCCPSVGCNNTNDTDCKPVCGNGVVEAGELCEPGSGRECPTTCASVGCNLFQPQGSDRCHVKCEAAGKITACKAVSDGCCAPGCNALMGSATFDADCSPVCGNGVVETGETCEGAVCDAALAGCVADKDNTIDPIGMVGKCTFDCQKKPRACAAGDGFCPSNCNFATDPDCKIPLGGNCIGAQASDCASGFCADGVCCAEACTKICFRCQAGTGTCAPLDKVDDFDPNICSGPTTCSNGQCLLKQNEPCTSSGGCISNICEDGYCRQFSCHADQQWFGFDCKTKNGQHCVPDWPCQDALCNFADNFCVSACPAGTTTSMTGETPVGGDLPGTCKLKNGQTCTMGGVSCASGLCDGDTNVCVSSCTGGKVPMMGLCKCDGGKEPDAKGVCKVSNNGQCDVGADCLSGLCNGFNDKCVAACSGGAAADADQVCKCSATQQFDGAGSCKTTNDNGCMNGATCLSGFCNIFTGTGKCVAMCPMAKTFQVPDSTCICSGLHEVPSGETGCDCDIGFTRDPGGVCKEINGSDCAAGTECASQICSAGQCAASCPTYQVPDGSGVCQAQTCAAGGTCNDAPKLCQEGLCVGGCDGNHYQAGDVCQPKKGAGAECTAAEQCTNGACEDDPADATRKICN